jgi:hypothetical protein
LSHDTTATISRRVNGLTLGPADTTRLRPLTDRIHISMRIPGTTPGAAPVLFPLGRYLIADAVQLPATGGTGSQVTLFDEMFVIDQDLEVGFDAGGRLADAAIRALLDGLPIGDPVIDGTDTAAATAWSPGTSRAAALMELATAGGYLKPWFDHHGRLRIVRAFDPADRAPDLDLDTSRRVIRGSITRSPQILDAPNRYVVVSNDPETTGTAVVGVYDVPASAPHSITQRGFVLPTVIEAQLPNARAAAIYARTLGLRQTVYEVIELSTPPDPRHDSYQVIRFDGTLWLETGWDLPLAAGAAMRHTLRRAYPTEPQ